MHSVPKIMHSILFYSMVMAAVSEFLCFLFDKFGKTLETNLKSLLVDFYEESEIMTAKEVLHAELE